ncbi:MAG TPA: glycogen/starch/alpha-glucan phosphorylase, partial [Kiritimatiellia bacterium]
FDVQVKRLHEYKRQLLNAMHVVALYHRIKDNPSVDIVPRTFIFGAKAAPSYHLAKVIIKFCNTLGQAINSDPDVADRLKVVFLPDYSVSLAEIIIPAAELSEQISTAGKEASGTGNMKLSLNGALTIGTWDGANIEIAEEVGLDNIFIFGHKAHELVELRKSGYRPHDYLRGDEELARIMEAIRDNTFAPEEGSLFIELWQSLVDHGDPYFHLADYRAYIECQERVSVNYRDRSDWNRKAVLNVARMSKFSSDRTIREYAEDIWKLRPLHVRVPTNGAAAELLGP